MFSKSSLSSLSPNPSSSQSKDKGELPPVTVRLIFPLDKLHEELSTTGLKEILSIASKVIQLSFVHPLSSETLMQ